VVAEIGRRGMKIRASKLDKGDVLFWNSLTIHGSLDSQDEHRSRSSITCHAIPSGRRFLQLQTRLFELPTERLGGAEIFRPKDQGRMKNRAVLFVESRFPGAF
jgi:phytanoyl-CoA hydroxylase